MNFTIPINALTAARKLLTRLRFERFTLPVLFGRNEVGFFGLLELGGILLAIALTGQIERRLDTSRPQIVGRLMLAITAAIAVSIAAFALSPLLGLAIALYLVIHSLGELTDPLLAAWMNQRLDPGVRATILSMTAQSQAVGQFVGGVAVGVLANVIAVPLALLVCGGLLSPAIAFVVRANRCAGNPPLPTLEPEVHNRP